MSIFTWSNFYLANSMALFFLSIYSLFNSFIRIPQKKNIRLTIHTWGKIFFQHIRNNQPWQTIYQPTPQLLLRQLPFYLDILALCLEAGMNLQNALKLTTMKAPSGELRQTFEQVLIETRTGQSWSYAWRNMANKLPFLEIQQLVTLIIQAEQFGLALAPILHTQSDQCRQSYFAKAEKKALEMPVKMLIPLILFIFPCSFIVLAFPITYELLTGWQ